MDRSAVIVLAWFCLAAIVGTQSAEAGSYTDLINKPYLLVRAQLIERGFKPVTLKHDEGADLFCLDKFCTQYPEALNCAGTGLNPCMFVYVRRHRYLIVDTHGETQLTVTGVHPAQKREILEIHNRL